METTRYKWPDQASRSKRFAQTISNPGTEFHLTVDMDIDFSTLEAIVGGLDGFGTALHPAALTASMIHSLAILDNKPDVMSHLARLERELKFRMASNSPSSQLKAIADRVAVFFSQTTTDGCRSLLAVDLGRLQHWTSWDKKYQETHLWKLICWFCETFTEFRDLQIAFDVSHKGLDCSRPR